MKEELKIKRGDVVLYTTQEKYGLFVKKTRDVHKPMIVNHIFEDTKKALIDTAQWNGAENMNIYCKLVDLDTLSM